MLWWWLCLVPAGGPQGLPSLRPNTAVNPSLQEVQDSEANPGGNVPNSSPLPTCLQLWLDALSDPELYPACLGNSTEIKVQAEVCPPQLHGLQLLLGLRVPMQRLGRGLGAAFAGCPICDVSVVKVEGCQDVQQPLSNCFCEPRHPVEACHCQRQPKKEAAVDLVGRLSPLLVPPHDHTRQTFLLAHGTMAIGIRPFLPRNL